MLKIAYLNVDQLRAHLRARELQTTAVRNELILRLEQFEKSEKIEMSLALGSDHADKEMLS